MKSKTLAEVKAGLMESEEFREAYEAEIRKERLQLLLAEWRQHAGLTSSQVAERMGIKHPTLSRMEKHINTVTLETLARYAKACGVENAVIYF